MIFRQILHEDLGCASYLVGDEHAGVAAVVDPRFEIDEYLELARFIGVRIEHVFETHNHADHVSGHGRLSAATGATILVHRLVAPEFEHVPFDDGDEFALGGVRLRAVHTPGHRPEHTAFLVADVRRSPEPWAVLAGDSLFVGDVARPDLAVERTEGARAIFRSLHERLLSLPDSVELWPGHVGGSMCGGPSIDLKVSSTIGYERVHSPLLQLETEAEFVAASVSRVGAQPPNFRAIVGLNHGPLLTDGIEPARLFPGQLGRRQAEGALVVDVRTDTQFAEAHIPGAISIALHRPGFGTKLAWVAAAGAEEIVFVGRDSDDGRRAGALAAAVGLGPRGRLLEGGMTSWTAEGRPLARLERLPVVGLQARRASVPALQILDVRERAEFDEGHIPGSLSVPWHDLDGVPDGLDTTLPVAVICASGQRAATAASLLQRDGAREVIHVTDGGVPRWGALGGPLTAERSPVRAAA